MWQICVVVNLISSQNVTFCFLTIVVMVTVFINVTGCFFIFKGPIIFVILQAFINISHVQNVRCLLITNFNLVNVIILQHGLMYLYGFIIIVTCERIYSGSCTIILNSKQMVLKLSHFKCGNKLCYKKLLFILLIATSTLEL